MRFSSLLSVNLLFHNVTLFQGQHAVFFTLLFNTLEALRFVLALFSLHFLRVHNHLFLGLRFSLSKLICSIIAQIKRVFPRSLLLYYVVIIQVEDSLTNLKAIKKMVGDRTGRSLTRLSIALMVIPGEVINPDWSESSSACVKPASIERGLAFWPCLLCLV